MIIDLPKEWHEGYHAYPLFNCAYPPASPECRDWIDGWTDAYNRDHYGDGPWGLPLEGPRQ